MTWLIGTRGRRRAGASWPSAPPRRRTNSPAPSSGSAPRRPRICARAEIGLVMATGRIGGDGRPFNLGEVSVTRAAVRLADGRTGFAYHLGRDRRRARQAAILDALWQGDRAGVEAALAPVARRQAEERPPRRGASPRRGSIS